MIKLINSPEERNMQIWTVLTSLIYMFGLFQDTYIAAFGLHPLLSYKHHAAYTIRTVITCTDVITTFFTAIPKEIS